MQCNQQSTAKEQGNDREQDSAANIASPMRIGRKAQIGQPRTLLTRRSGQSKSTAATRMAR
jgi:hypothetical protein